MIDGRKEQRACGKLGFIFVKKLTDVAITDLPASFSLMTNMMQVILMGSSNASIKKKKKKGKIDNNNNFIFALAFVFKSFVFKPLMC